MAHLSDSPPVDPSKDPTPHGLTSDTMSISKKFIGAVKDEWSLYSDCASDYIIGEPIGYGASSIVYTATYHPQGSCADYLQPTPIPCALKVLDLDSLSPRSLRLLQRETTLMSLSKHPNVLRVRGSWMDGHKLYIALRLMKKGSAADVMRYGWPGGMEEDVVGCILRQGLKGLNYLHVNGFIHRDIKAANLLIDDDGTVLLGDLGVAADLSEDSSHHILTGSRSEKGCTATATSALAQTQWRSVSFDTNAKSKPKIGKRKSFVGTPCWMAPELIEGRQYDSAADIWSFGITALELSQGRPPRSRESSKDVLLRIIHDAPPTLDREGGTYKYSRSFKEMVESCLIKDPTKRPTAAQLLQTPFFKSAKKKSYLINTILKDLPPLTQRQERRALRHTLTVQTIDSWDFYPTVSSPTSTIHHWRKVPDDIHSRDADHTKNSSVSYSESEHDSSPLSSPQGTNHDGPPRKGNRGSAVWSSSGDSLSTDTAERAPSTPPTDSSVLAEPLQNPDLLESDPATQSSSPSHKLGARTKKPLWSRITSNIRKPSFRGVSPARPAPDEPSAAKGIRHPKTS